MIKKIKIGNYQASAVAMYVLLNGSDDPITSFICPYAVPEHRTVLMPFTTFLNGNSLQFEKFAKELEESGIAKPMTRWGAPAGVQADWVFYPQWEFNEQKLRELCGDKAVDKYIAEWQRGYEKLYPPI